MTMPIRRLHPIEEPPKDSVRLLLIGVDHRTAPIELREQVSYKDDEAELLLRDLIQSREISEAFILSTCNRTEIYVHPNADQDAYRVVLERGFVQRAPEIAEGRFYVKRGDEAARHLMEVAGGLQSMVLGEPEILGQVRQAGQLATRTGTSTKVLHQLLESAIDAGGRARSKTAISAGAVSFGYCVVDLARNIFKSLEDCSVLLVGAGEMARQVARSLSERGAKELVVCNRSRPRAEEFCETFPQARIVPLEDLYRAIEDCDVVVASTAAEEPVIRLAELRATQRVEKRRPFLLVDLGMPRNIEPQVEELENVFLHDIDSLQSLIARNLKQRRVEIPRVQEILDRELAHFHQRLRNQDAQPVIGALHKKAEAIRQRELSSWRARFPEDLHDDLERMTRSLLRKMLHHPSAKLREDASPEHVEIIRTLFRLDDEEEKS